MHMFSCKADFLGFGPEEISGETLVPVCTVALPIVPASLLWPLQVPALSKL